MSRESRYSDFVDWTQPEDLEMVERRKGVSEVMGALEQRMASVADRIGHSVIPPVEKRRLMSKLEMVGYTAKGLARFALILGAMYSFEQIGEQAAPVFTGTKKVLKDTAHWNESRYAVHETTSDNGEIEYTHEDKETDQILNYLSGKSELDEQFKQDILVDGLIDFCKAKGLDSMVEDLGTITDPEELRKFIVTHTEVFNAYNADMVNIAMNVTNGEWMQVCFVKKREYNQKVYQALWSIERQTGNAKIRFMHEGVTDPRLKVQKRAFYHSQTNTMYISPPLIGFISLYDYIAEASHGKHYNEHFYETEYLHYKQQKAQEASGLDSWEYHETTYSEPGTIEHRAHSDIQPVLERQLDKAAGIPVTYAEVRAAMNKTKQEADFGPEKFADRPRRREAIDDPTDLLESDSKL